MVLVSYVLSPGFGRASLGQYRTLANHPQALSGCYPFAFSDVFGNLRTMCPFAYGAVGSDGGGPKYAGHPRIGLGLPSPGFA
jgi:hypothetical protein